MRKAVLLATVMAFACSDFALAVPAPFASAGKTVVSGSGSDLTLVRRKSKRKSRVVRQRGTATTVAPAGRGSVAAPSRMNSTNPGAAPSGQSPSVDQGLRVGGGR